MEVITAQRAVARRSITPVVAGTIVGTLLLCGGLVMAYVTFATPFLSWIMPSGRFGVGEAVVGVVVWSIALVVPFAFMLLGAARLANLLAAAKPRAPRASSLQSMLGDLPDEVVLAPGLMLPDGRGVTDVLVGPFGAAVIRPLPPADRTRVREGTWELRTGRGWIRLENPLDRAARDAERVRRWLGHDDTDFVVKTYAAVIGPEPTVARTTSCAVLTPDQIPAWIAALPPQRSLTPGRLERMLDTVRRAAH